MRNTSSFGWDVLDFLPVACRQKKRLHFQAVVLVRPEEALEPPDDAMLFRYALL